MGLSTIVPVDNRPELLTYFFTNLLPFLRPGEDELIIVSDACWDSRVLKSLKRLAKHSDLVRLMLLREKLGYGRACNLAASKARKEVLLFINTDVFPQTGALQILGDEVRNDPSVGATQGLLIYPQTNRVQSTGHIFHDYLNFHALEGCQVDNRLVQTRQERQALTSAFYAIRREVFEKFGGFDEFFFNAWEGMELTLRLTHAGMRCVYNPTAQAFHVRGGGRRHYLLDETQQAAYFWAKWGSRIKNDLEDILRQQLTPQLQRFDYLAINCGSTSTWRNAIERLHLRVQSTMALPDRFEENICLYDNLSHSVLDYPGSILFFSDHFEQLANNREWFRARQSKGDLVIDLHGNLLAGSELC